MKHDGARMGGMPRGRSSTLLLPHPPLHRVAHTREPRPHSDTEARTKDGTEARPRTATGAPTQSRGRTARRGGQPRQMAQPATSLLQRTLPHTTLCRTPPTTPGGTILPLTQRHSPPRPSPTTAHRPTLSARRRNQTCPPNTIHHPPPTTHHTHTMDIRGGRYMMCSLQGGLVARMDKHKVGNVPPSRKRLRKWTSQGPKATVGEGSLTAGLG